MRVSQYTQTPLLTTEFFSYSAVMVSSFRISVFIHDISPDMTYTLAPDAGWTLIEMTAAVVSVSLPALGPAVIEAQRRLRSCGLFGQKRTEQCPERLQATSRRAIILSEFDIGIRSQEEERQSAPHMASDATRQQEVSGAVQNERVTPWAVEGNVSGGQEDKTLSLMVTRSEDGASDEVPMNSISARRSMSQSSCRHA